MHIALPRFTWYDEICFCRSAGSSLLVWTFSIAWCWPLVSAELYYRSANGNASCNQSFLILAHKFYHWRIPRCKAEPCLTSFIHTETLKQTSLLSHTVYIFLFPQAVSTDTYRHGVASPRRHSWKLLCRIRMFTQWHFQHVIPKANQ